MQHMRRLLLTAVIAAFAVASGLAQDILLKDAYVGADKRVHLVTASGRHETVPAEKGQDGVENVDIAKDGRTAGWLVDQWSSCCVSYSVPTELVIWRNGRAIRRIESRQAIFGWTFLNDGKEVAYHVAPLHGDEIYECYRVEVRTGRELEHWSMMSKTPAPFWVKLLDEQFPMPDPDTLPLQP